MRSVWIIFEKKQMRMESFPQNSHRSAVEKNLGYTPCTVFLLLIPQLYENVEKCTKAIRPDCVELMPGVMPKVIRQMAETLSVPVIAGGLISDKEDIIAALDAGAGVDFNDERRTVVSVIYRRKKCD